MPVGQSREATSAAFSRFHLHGDVVDQSPAGWISRRPSMQVRYLVHAGTQARLEQSCALKQRSKEDLGMNRLGVARRRLPVFGALVLLPALLSAPLMSPAAAQSPEVRQACTNDAFRLCNQFIPDVGRTKACLFRYRASLSPVCRAAFTHRARRRR
jgi:hypothetical protein